MAGLGGPWGLTYPSLLCPTPPGQCFPGPLLALGPSQGTYVTYSGPCLPGSSPGVWLFSGSALGERTHWGPLCHPVPLSVVSRVLFSPWCHQAQTLFRKHSLRLLTAQLPVVACDSSVPKPPCLPSALSSLFLAWHSRLARFAKPAPPVTFLIHLGPTTSGPRHTVLQNGVLPPPHHAQSPSGRA